MKAQLFYALFIFLFIQVSLKLSPQKREELLNKFTKKITLDNLGNIKPQIYVGPTLNYTVKEIKEILDKYDFPLNYDFFNETGCQKRVKNQGRCGSCWSFGSTTALSYRFYQTFGIDVDLSPQDPLSCYLKDCEMGNYLIDAQMNLIKNGTVTESCFPYTSGGNATIEECITECKNETEEYIKYYAQNFYETESYLNQENFLDIVTLIIDQLITKGPLVVRFNVYNDFYYLNKSVCEKEDYIYTYDEISPMAGGHAVTLVGYGFLNEKFYWLIQNSWGEKFCDNGFIKMEFGQAGIEAAAFSDPYFHEENTTNKTNINVKFIEQNSICEITVDTDSNYSEWNNTLEIQFKNEEKNKNFVYHCSKIDIKEKGEIIKCYNEIRNYFSYKGKYTFQGYEALGDENQFILDEKFKTLEFEFLGYNSINAPISEYYFVSDEGSRILMSFRPNRYDEEIKFPTIYVGKNLNKSLSNCNIIEGFPYAYCDISKEELNYFDEFSWDNRTDSDFDLHYFVLCNYLDYTDVIVYRLNKDLYPVFTIRDFQFEKVDLISNSTQFTLIADIDGNRNNTGYNSFINVINIESKGENKTNDMVCILDESFNIKCKLDIEEEINYDNVYLLPYYLPLDYSYPTELIIKNEIKANIIEPTPTPEEEEETEEESEEPEPEEEESVEPEPEEEESVEPEPEEEESVEPEPRA